MRASAANKVNYSTTNLTCAHCANFRRTSYRLGGQCKAKKRWSTPLGHNLCLDIEPNQAACEEELLVRETKDVLVTVHLGLDVEATQLNDGHVTFAIDSAVVVCGKHSIPSEVSRYVTREYGENTSYSYSELSHEEF